MENDIAVDEIVRRVLLALLSDCRVVSAIYQPRGDPPAWAAALVGQRSMWTLHPMLERSSDARHWAMTPYPLPMAIEKPARWVPLEHLHATELVGSVPGE